MTKDTRIVSSAEHAACRADIAGERWGARAA
jgi:hypothetical protein